MSKKNNEPKLTDEEKQQLAKNKKTRNSAKKLLPILNVFGNGIFEKKDGSFSRIYSMAAQTNFEFPKCNFEIFTNTEFVLENEMAERSKKFNLPEFYSESDILKTNYYLVLTARTNEKKNKEAELEKIFDENAALFNNVTPLTAEQTLQLMYKQLIPSDPYTKINLSKFGNKIPKADKFITPDRLIEKKDFLYVDDNVSRTYMISDYSFNFNKEAYADITHTNGVFTFATHFELMDNIKTLECINKSLGLDTTKEKKHKKEQEINMSDSEKTKYEILKKKIEESNKEEKPLYKITSYVTIYSNSEDDIEEATNFFFSRSADYNIVYIPLWGQQLKAFFSSMPFGLNQCNASRIMSYEDYIKLIPNPTYNSIFNNGIYYGNDIANCAPIIIDRIAMERKNGFVLGTECSKKEKEIKREISSITGNTQDPVIIIDEDGSLANVIPDAEVIDVTQCPLFAVNDDAKLKCTMLGNLARIVLNSSVQLKNEEKEELDNVLQSIQDKENFTFDDFISLIPEISELSSRVLPNLKNLPDNCKFPVEAKPITHSIIYDFSNVDNEFNNYSLKAVYTLMAVAYSHAQAAASEANGNRIWIYVNGIETTMHNIRGAKYLAEVFKEEREKIIITYIASDLDTILSNTKQIPKSDKLMFSGITKSLSDCDFVIVYHINPVNRALLTKVLHIQPKQVENFKSEKDAGLIVTPYRRIPFEF